MQRCALLMLVLAAPAFGQIHLTWDPPEWIPAGGYAYRVHWGTNSLATSPATYRRLTNASGARFANTFGPAGTPYQHSACLESNRFTLTNLAPGLRYWAAVTIETTLGESPFSNELEVFLPPPPPVNFRITAELQAAAQLQGPFRAVAAFDLIEPAAGAARFYRAALKIKPEPDP